MKCSFCDRFFSQFKCWAKSRGECDCPKCHGYCECEQNMLQKPEALRLADWLEYGNYNHEDVIKAAAKLRRLHVLNQELLNALHCISLAAQDSGSTREGMGLYARGAIAKAENNK
jgi:hypothetical protein